MLNVSCSYGQGRRVLSSLCRVRVRELTDTDQPSRTTVRRGGQCSSVTKGSIETQPQDKKEEVLQMLYVSR